MRILHSTILALGLSLLALSAGAVPAQKGVKKQIRLADGSVVTATLQGDELLSYYLLPDGRPVVSEGEGRYRLETAEGLQTLRRNALLREATFHGGKTLDQRRAARLPRRNAARAAAMEGQKKGLVLLVNFTDNAFTTPDTRNYYQRYFNEAGFNQGGMTGSVHDYFFDQSYGRLSVDFDIAGPITLSHNMAYYGGAANGEHDNYPHILEMVKEACMAVDNQLNFADYDWDGDGEVDQVFLIYAGYGQASGGDDNTIWPHAFGLGNQSIQLDGVWVNTYACSNELNIDNTTTGIGTACHEFSHCLGLADHYDTSSQGNPTPEAWDLMASGSYNNNQRTPVGYTAFERWLSGWLEPTEINAPTTVTGMKPIDQTPEAYILTNDNNPDEFYILENRQLSKWNRFPGGHGLLIMHVDYDARYFVYNQVNVEADHLRMQVVPADGSIGSSYEGDTWPGTGDKRRFTDDTTPRASVFTADRDGNLTLGKPVTAIREAADGTLSFTAMEGVMPKPAMLPFTNVTAGGFTANWTPVDGATRYTVALRQVPAAPATPAEAVRVYETFDQCVAGSVGMSNIAKSLDKVLNQAGFTGTYCYKSPGGLQLGRGANLGSLKTPDLSEPLSGQVTVLVGVAPSGQNTEGTCKLNLTTGGHTYSVNLTGDGENVNVVPTEEGLMAESAFNVEVCATGKPMVLYFLSVLDGVFSNEALSEWVQTLDAPAEVQWHALTLPAASGKAALRRVKGTVTEYSTDAPTYTFSGLAPGNDYFVSVKAHSANGASRWSAEQMVDVADGIASPFEPLQRTQQAYDLGGRPADRRFRGVIIRNGKLIVQ